MNGNLQAETKSDFWSDAAACWQQLPNKLFFFTLLAAHWKKSYPGWTAWVLTPDLKLPTRMRLKESRRVPMWNGPIECRLFRFDMVKGSARKTATPPDADSDGP